ncbi:uncharacterized protein LOC141605778 [Silene latifolia]|uniref:uncharacterized protein LOC141605778 n=1 Tax=Silene latifolia TaxID=37657 RepID=UPI003D773C83
MGKSLPSTTVLKNLTRVISSDKIKNSPKQAKPISSNYNNNNNKVSANPNSQGRFDSAKLGLKMENSGATRVPLSMAVSDCVKRWFHDTLKEAKNGDISMQLLVGQMYNSGYGVRKDLDKGHAWITIASKSRSSAWRVSNKQPGYNASDTDSEDIQDARR